MRRGRSRGNGESRAGDVGDGPFEPADDPSDALTFDDQLEELGFRRQGTTRRGGTMWVLAFNRHLTFVLHDYRDTVVLSWSFALGEYVDEKGWRVGISDTSAVELYPVSDVRLPLDVDAVGGEITRVLASLRLDLGQPTL